MNQIYLSYQGNHKMIIEKEYISDSPLNENKNQKEEIIESNTNIQTSFENLNRNKTKKDKDLIKSKEGNLVSKEALPSIQLVTGGESIKTKNLGKGVFGYATIFFKQFFKERFDLNLDKFNCQENLGVGIGHMKRELNLGIYQIL